LNIYRLTISTPVGYLKSSQVCAVVYNIYDIQQAHPVCINGCIAYGLFGPNGQRTVVRAGHICLLFSQLQLKFFTLTTGFGAKIIAKPICGNYLMCTPRWEPWT